MNSASFVCCLAVVVSILSSFRACRVVLSTDLPEYRNFPHTSWICVLSLADSSGDLSTSI